MLSGPIVGSILYTAVGFQGTFFAIGAWFIALVPIMFCVIPQSVDSNDKNIIIGGEILLDVCNRNPNTTNHKPIRYLDLMTRKVFMMTAMWAFLSYFAWIKLLVWIILW